MALADVNAMFVCELAAELSIVNAELLGVATTVAFDLESVKSPVGLVVPIPTLPEEVRVIACVPAPEAAVKKPRFEALSLLRENVEVPMLSVPAQRAFQRAVVVPRSKAEIRELVGVLE
jgi:hypothetical protein